MMATLVDAVTVTDFQVFKSNDVHLAAKMAAILSFISAVLG